MSVVRALGAGFYDLRRNRKRKILLCGDVFVKTPKIGNFLRVCDFPKSTGEAGYFLVGTSAWILRFRDQGSEWRHSARSEVAESTQPLAASLRAPTRNPVFPPFIQKIVGVPPRFFGNSYRQKVGVYFLPNPGVLICEIIPLWCQKKTYAEKTQTF
jgi:hypothetical protein